MTNKGFKDIFGDNDNKPKKENPFTKQKAQKQQYKSVRIYPEDFKEYRRLAFHQEKTIVEVISESLKLYKQKYEGESEETDN
ncbi:hypothetical protein [Halobacillus litoralis]|uniref:hypothetical protein n=1 Tax=Halobacillus litoralis TaxID=45668 RepID=UPI00136EF327|nr:hypothetical protein [Halobacillus litoralis]MYL39815.1 hypothetical protein [Halobacillus litoralis]